MHNNILNDQPTNTRYRADVMTLTVKTATSRGVNIGYKGIPEIYIIYYNH